MKKLLIGISFLLCVMADVSFVYTKSAVARRRRGWFSRKIKNRSVDARNKRNALVINRLTKVESAMGKYVSQIAFEFVKPLYYETSETKRGEQVKLYFPGLRLSDFKGNQTVSKIKKLGIVKSVFIEYEKIPISRVVLTMNFEKDVAILRLTKMEEPNLLVLDLFDKPTLKTLREKITTLFKASNDVSRCGKGLQGRGSCLDGNFRNLLLCLNKEVPFSGGGSRFSGSSKNFDSKKKKKILPKKLSIVIDAGHGGRDDGAQSFGLKEKAITLDIARRVYSNLKKEGYRVFLTRNTDSYLSVVDRFQLAQQLKADLFVSIHVNAVAGVERVSGVETHFLDGTPFFGKQKRSSFLFVKNKNDKLLVQVVNKLLQRKITSSRRLSGLIQSSILTSLNKRNINVFNRGIKRTGFRTLLRSEVPSSIVEVGFLTNKEEAKRLSKPLYRSFLAEGICGGVKKFLWRV